MVEGSGFRMPAILHRTGFDHWLDRTVKDPHEFQRLFQPYSVEFAAGVGVFANGQQPGPNVRRVCSAPLGETMTSLLTVVILLASIPQANSTPSLPSCPTSPNCVSSQAADSHRIEPFQISGDDQVAFKKLRAILTHRSDTKIISSDDITIRVEFRTLLGFVDEGLFVLDATNSLIHVRSAARTGYWDLGKNRSRMEDIRRAFLTP